MKPTEGKWEINETTSYFGLEDFIKEHNAIPINFETMGFALGACGILVLTDTVGKEKAMANANLIVAGKDMFEALKEIYECGSIKKAKQIAGKILNELKLKEVE